MNFSAALLSTVILLCAAFIRAEREEDHEIPLVERRSYEVAFVGRPFVYAVSNLGGNDVAKVIEMKRDELPGWLSYDPGKALLVGVPLWRDKGDIDLDFQSVKHSLKIEVKDLRDAGNQQAFPSLNRTEISSYSQPKCPKGLPVAAATIVFDLNMARLDGEARVRLLNKVSEFVNVNVRNIHMSAGKGHTTAFGLKDVIMVTAGPGNVADSKEPGVVVSWQIGCGTDVAGARVASFLKSRTETGALGPALNTPVSEWHITIGYPKEPRIRTRRQTAQFNAPKATRRLTKRNIVVPTRAIQATPTPIMTAALPSSVISQATVTITKTSSLLPTTSAIPFTTPVEPPISTEQFTTTKEATTTQEPTTISTTLLPSTTEEATPPAEETTTRSPTTTEESPTTPVTTTTEATSTPPPSTTKELTTTLPPSTTEELTTTPPPSTTEELTTTTPPSTTEELTTTTPPSTTEEVTTTLLPSTTQEITTTPPPSTTHEKTTTPPPSTTEVTTTQPTDEPSTMFPTVTTVEITTPEKVTTKQPVTKTTTVAENKEPKIINPVDRLNVYEGQGLWYQIPNDTFYDEEDFYTPNLTLSLRTIEWKSTPQWIKLDPKNQVIYALPLHEKTIALHEFVLIAADKEGLQAYDAIEVNVMEDTALYNHQFTVEIDYDHTAFSKNLTARLLLLDKIAKYFNVNMSNIRVVSYRSGSVFFTFQFDFVAHDDCFFPLRKEFLSDENVNPRFKKALLPEFPVKGGKFEGLGPCSDVIGPDVGAVGSRPLGAWETYAIVPVIALAVVLFIIGVCVLLVMRCRRKQTLSEEDKHTFIYKRKPAVLQEEYEVKEHLLKQPLVLPNEKPPLSPPQSPRNPSISHPTNGPELAPGYHQPSFTSSRQPGNQVSPGGNSSRKPGYSGYRLPPAYVPP